MSRGSSESWGFIVLLRSLCLFENGGGDPLAQIIVVVSVPYFPARIGKPRHLGLPRRFP